MNQLYVISQTDLYNFGCPHCGGRERGESFLSFGSCTLWYCDDCTREIAIVQKSIREVLQFRIRDTDILDYIGKHPYKKVTDCMIMEKFFQLEPGLSNIKRRQGICLVYLVPIARRMEKT